MRFLCVLRTDLSLKGCDDARTARLSAQVDKGGVASPAVRFDPRVCLK